MSSQVERLGLILRDTMADGCIPKPGGAGVERPLMLIL